MLDGAMGVGLESNRPKKITNNEDGRTVLKGIPHAGPCSAVEALHGSRLAHESFGIW